MPFDKTTATQAGKTSKRGKAKNINSMRVKFEKVLSKNLKNIDTWLNEVAKNEPAKALDLILKLSSFVMPKVKAIEVTEVKEGYKWTEDLSLLSDEELNERIKQVNRVLHPASHLPNISFVDREGNEVGQYNTKQSRYEGN